MRGAPYVKLRKKIIELLYRMIAMKPKDVIKSLEEMILIVKDSEVKEPEVNAPETKESTGLFFKEEKPVEKKQKRKYNTLKGQD